MGATSGYASSLAYAMFNHGVSLTLMVTHMARFTQPYMDRASLVTR